MTSCPHAHWSFEYGSEVLFQSTVNHSSRCVIQWTKKHSGEGESNVVFRTRILAPLVLLETANALSVYEVGPGPGHRCRTNRAMKVDKHLALGRFATDLGVEVHD